MSTDILIVDDEADIRRLIKGILEDEGFTTRQAETSKEAYALIEDMPPALAILDIWLQGSDHDGLQILQKMTAKWPHIPVIMISGHGTIETAVSAIKQGAYDFIEKPFKSDRLLLMIRRALETASLRRENEALKKTAKKPQKMIGQSLSFQALQATLSKVASTNSRVLITGEAGTGKELAAKAIHEASSRANYPFMTISCAMMRPDMLETELFGSNEGSGHNKLGMLEQAHQGTLLLDEVADMPLETQAKILRVLQEQRFQRPGTKEEVHIDVRIIASSNRNLEQVIREEKFRQDLYYRLNVVPIHIPPLRERVEDIQDLAAYFLEEFSKQTGTAQKSLSASCLSAMQSYAWPGNIRQLRNVIEWLVIMSGSGDLVFNADHLPPEVKSGSDINALRMQRNNDSDLITLPLREAREVFEREYLQKQINRFGGNISKTAQFIGMERSALHRKLKSLNILGAESEGKSEEMLPRHLRA